MSWDTAIEAFKYGVWTYFTYLAFCIGHSKGHMEGVLVGYRKALVYNELMYQIQVGIIERLRSHIRGDIQE